jgi:hypothetical protein
VLRDRELTIEKKTLPAEYAELFSPGAKYQQTKYSSAQTIRYGNSETIKPVTKGPQWY